MAGSVIRLLERTEYDFSNVSSQTAHEYVVAEHVDVSQWQYATLMIRIHDAELTENDATLTVTAYADGYTMEDPTAVFAVSVASDNVSNSDTFPYYRTVELPADEVGTMLRFTIKGTQGQATGTVKGTYSLDLSLKS